MTPQNDPMQNDPEDILENEVPSPENPGAPGSPTEGLLTRWQRTVEQHINDFVEGDPTMAAKYDMLERIGEKLPAGAIKEIHTKVIQLMKTGDIGTVIRRKTEGLLLKVAEPVIALGAIVQPELVLLEGLAKPAEALRHLADQVSIAGSHIGKDIGVAAIESPVGRNALDIMNHMFDQVPGISPLQPKPVG